MSNAMMKKLVFPPDRIRVIDSNGYQLANTDGTPRTVTIAANIADYFADVRMLPSEQVKFFGIVTKIQAADVDVLLTFDEHEFLLARWNVLNLKVNKVVALIDAILRGAEDVVVTEAA